MSSDKPTLRLRQRLVSFDAGEHFKPAFAASPEELDAHWPALFAAMDAETKAKAERVVPADNRKTFLATYLAIAPAHLVIDAAADQPRARSA